MVNNFQREGSVSNAHVGRNFEERARSYFAEEMRIHLRRNFDVQIGVRGPRDTRDRKFDLGAIDPPILVECKSHTWTSGGNVPSAKITQWNEAMYFFHLAPQEYRKILFVQRDFNQKKEETLGQYYVRTHRHLIPEDVEILEFDSAKSVAVSLPIR